ncbi:GATA-binding factor C [Papilio machaon]|uniref:GATA-binding factor C n=1 Tax=Papilio machaon TaxID=76193 RepID=A0A194QW88_PAPMA|nr:GATA-binding factor C [Papilio machaon]
MWKGYVGLRSEHTSAHAARMRMRHASMRGCSDARRLDDAARPCRAARYFSRCRTLSGGSGQVCRPHFHTPLHPWLDSKALGGGAWGGGFQQEGAQADKPLSPAQHHHPHPLFSFPPTPPKDSTPDSVAAAALGQQDYQAAVAHATAMSVAFMQQQQELPLCGDVKPMMGAPPSKQREGAQPDSCPQDASQPSGEYNAQYNAASGDYYGYQGKGYSQQQSKPRPNKTRTSAGESARSSLHSPRPL